MFDHMRRLIMGRYINSHVIHFLKGDAWNKCVPQTNTPTNKQTKVDFASSKLISFPEFKIRSHYMLLEQIDMYNINQPVKLYFIKLINCITFTFNDATSGKNKDCPFVLND